MYLRFSVDQIRRYVLVFCCDAVRICVFLKHFDVYINFIIELLKSFTRIGMKQVLLD